MEFRKELLTDESILVRCRTEEQANELKKWAVKNGKKKWDDDSNYGWTSWQRHGEDTCYGIANDVRASFWGADTWDDTEIIEFDDAIQDFKSAFNQLIKQRGDENV